MGRAKDQKAPVAESIPSEATVVVETAATASTEPEAPAADPEVVEAEAPGVDLGVYPFGKPTVIVHKKEDGGTGIPASAMQAQPLEADYVEPGDRSNPEYLAKLADEKAADDEQKAKADKAKRAFGFGTRPIVFGGSPNSPQAKINLIS